MRQEVHSKVRRYLRGTEGGNEAFPPCFGGPVLEFLLEVTLGPWDCLVACEALSKQINELCGRRLSCYKKCALRLIYSCKLSEISMMHWPLIFNLSLIKYFILYSSLMER